jgi:adenosine deaminase
MNLSRDEMVTLTRNGFHMAWLSESEKEAYLDSIEAYVIGRVPDRLEHPKREERKLSAWL